VHRKPHLRGALTTGNKWVFVTVAIDADHDGAKYYVSEPIGWSCMIKENSDERLVETTSNRDDPALIAGILSSWVSMLDLVVSSTGEADVHFCQIPESFLEFNGDQWFVKKKYSLSATDTG
jgi:hypothetical protein